MKENSILYKTSFENEIHRIMIHGILHLIGFKDKIRKDKLLMTEKEDESLNLLNLIYCKNNLKMFHVKQ